MWKEYLPAFNATCNGVSLLCLIAGRLAIRKRLVAAHKRWMLTAFGFSMLFLAGYLTRHAVSGTTYFRGQGLWRTLYLSILGTHTILAAINLPLILAAMRWGLKNQIERHRKLVRFAYPIWVYVSATGVVIYFLLYRWPT